MADSELEKHADSLPARQVINEFLEWLDGQKIELGTPNASGRWLERHFEDRARMLQRYFGIDDAKLEKERQAIVSSMGGRANG